MLLRDYVFIYGQGRDIEPATIEQYGYAVTSLEKHLGQPVDLVDLRAEIINTWIAARISGGISRATVSKQRAAVLTVWRDAADQGLAAQVGKIRRVRLDPPMVETWWPSEFKTFLGQAVQARGAFECGVPRGAMLLAFYLAKYDSGLRLSDLLLIESSQFLSQQRFMFRQHKTRHPLPIEFSQACVDAIAATYPERRKMLFPLRRKQVWSWTRLLCQRAGLRGSPKWVRRYGATRCEQQQPGSAMSYLGHKTPGLAWKNYIHQAQIDNVRPLPPPIS